MHTVTWDGMGDPQPNLRERVHNAKVFALWFVLGSRAAKRLTNSRKR